MKNYHNPNYSLYKKRSDNKWKKRRKECSKRWYEKNKKRQFENVKRYYHLHNKEKQRERRYVSTHREEIFNIIGDKCIKCGKEAKEIDHLKYNFPKRKQSPTKEEVKIYLKEYCKFLRPLCSNCHRTLKNKVYKEVNGFQIVRLVSEINGSTNQFSNNLNSKNNF